MGGDKRVSLTETILAIRSTVDLIQLPAAPIGQQRAPAMAWPTAPTTREHGAVLDCPGLVSPADDWGDPVISVLWRRSLAYIQNRGREIERR